MLTEDRKKVIIFLIENKSPNTVKLLRELGMTKAEFEQMRKNK